MTIITIYCQISKFFSGYRFNGVCFVDMPHDPGKIAGRRFDQQMKMAVNINDGLVPQHGGLTN